MTFFGVTMFDPSQNIAKWKGLSENTLPSIIRWFVFMFAIKNASTCYIPVIYPPFSHTHTPKKQAEQMPGGGSLQSPPADPDGGLARIWPQQMRRLDLWPVKNPVAASAFWSILYCGVKILLSGPVATRRSQVVPMALCLTLMCGCNSNMMKAAKDQQVHKIGLIRGHREHWTLLNYSNQILHPFPQNVK